MIKNRLEKQKEIVSTIKSRIQEINFRYRNGPDIHFYHRVLSFKRKIGDIGLLLKDQCYLDLLYATLVAWDMNARGARIKGFDDFKDSILKCSEFLKEMERFEMSGSLEFKELSPLLKETYECLHVMRSRSRLVSNSKLLHFMFPDLLMPMDRKNVLSYFYGNGGDSMRKYLEIIEFSMDIMKLPENWENYLDDGWNTSIPKMIDNAIILLVGRSLR